MLPVVTGHFVCGAYLLATMAEQLEVLVEVALAMLLGGIIGLERELAGKDAGLRTNMMVAAAAALFVGLGDVLVRRFAQDQVGVSVTADPIRIVEATITGVSFLGAGMIFKREGNVEGLTTAASMLLTAGIGTAVALRQFVLAIALVLVTVVVLRSLVPLERWITRRTQNR
jgi:putative Mg2+ transporter-C (MgtC) family protein